MNDLISPLYSTLPENLSGIIEHAVHQGLAACPSVPVVFFRADDIGVPSRLFSAMIELFLRYQVPLNLAVVPSWLTQPRRDSLFKITRASSLFCWHQHGWRHMNHEKKGKKQEFGDSREHKEITSDMAKGKKRLQHLLGNAFTPFFTPPWNRCGQKTLDSLITLNYSGLSRSGGAQPIPEEPLLEFGINVDLHTRKERRPDESLRKLLDEIRTTLAAGRSGIMLHHQRMNENSIIFLDMLLNSLVQTKQVQFHHFASITGNTLP